MKRLNLGDRKKKRTEINSTRNDVTGDKLTSRPSSNAYDENYVRIFGEGEPKATDTTWVWRPDEQSDKQG